MAIDYNRLMEELDSCLGLESSATKSVKRPSGPSKKRKAFEGYDDVDMEIIQAMKDSPEGAPSEFSEEDLVYSENDQGMPGVEDEEADNEESPEVKLADSIDCLFNDYVQSGKTPQEAADSIKDLVESAVAELYDPDDEEAEADEGMKGVVTPVREVSSHSLANRSAEESIDKSRLEEIYEDFFDEAELGISPSLGETIKHAKDYLRGKSPEDLEKSFGEYADPVRLAKKMLEMDKIDNGPGGKPISKARLEEIYEDFFDGSGLGPDPDPEDTVEHARDFYLIGWTPNELKKYFGPYADPELLAKKMLEMHRAYNKADREGRSTNRSAEESIDKSRLEEIYEDFFDEAELGISPSLGETIKHAKDYLRGKSPEDLEKSFGEYADPVRLAKKMLEMDKIDNGPGGKPISKARLEEIYEDFFDGSGLGPDPDPEDTVEHARDFYLIGWTPNELKKYFGPYADPELLAKKMLEMHRAYNKADREGRSTNRSAEESSSKSPSPEEIKVIKYIKKAFGDLYNSGLYRGDGEEGSWEDLLGNEADEIHEYGLDDEESMADYAETKMLGVPFKTKDQVRTLSKNVDKAYGLVKKYGEEVFSSGSSATESNSKTVNDDPYDPDAAFEALSSKMLNRYSQLTHRNQLKSKKSAEEGVSATEVKINDDAIRRVSCEFAYSGKNLRKMVAEAIKKGVI